MPNPSLYLDNLEPEPPKKIVNDRAETAQELAQIHLANMRYLGDKIEAYNRWECEELEVIEALKMHRDSWRDYKSALDEL